MATRAKKASQSKQSDFACIYCKVNMESDRRYPQSCPKSGMHIFKKKKAKKAKKPTKARPTPPRYNDHGFDILNAYFAKVKDTGLSQAWLDYSGYQMLLEMEVEEHRSNWPSYNDRQDPDPDSDY
jgi:hypothetical protein